MMARFEKGGGEGGCGCSEIESCLSPSALGVLLQSEVEGARGTMQLLLCLWWNKPPSGGDGRAFNIVGTEIGGPGVRGGGREAHF